MGLYYRATTDILAVGGNPGPKAYDYSDNAERHKLEEFLENLRPPASCSRFKSWFACDDKAKSAKYLEAELARRRTLPTAAPPRLYEVEIKTFSRQPMILVNAIAKALDTGDPSTAEMLANEYWQPTQPWKFWEYTAHEIGVIREVEWPDSMAQSLALMAYQGDDIRLKQFFNLR